MHAAKESTRVLVAKKREIFIVQVGLDVKVEEIAKLKERAVQRDAALSKAERMLEDDTRQFDAFLKENAAKLQEAVAFADTQTMAKQEKVLDQGGTIVSLLIFLAFVVANYILLLLHYSQASNLQLPLMNSKGVVSPLQDCSTPKCLQL